MEKLTHKRSSGIKTGYWSPNKKEELVSRLAEYENTGLTPEQICEMDKLYQEKCREVAELQKQQQWIPVGEQLPEDGCYICTMDGALCGQEEPFVGMCGIEKGVWDDPECVFAWMPLPEPYKAE